MADQLLREAENATPAKATALAARVQSSAIHKLTQSVDKFSTTSRRQTRVLIILTAVLAALTVVLIWLTATQLSPAVVPPSGG